MNAEHYRALEAMYKSAPINALYPPEIEISDRQAIISIEVKPEYFHSMGALHGSVYFKLLDDSAALAAASINEANPMLTVSFTTELKRPVSKGRVKAVGKVVRVEGAKMFLESVMYDDNNQQIATGSGLFLPAKVSLSEVESYKRMP